VVVLAVLECVTDFLANGRTARLAQQANAMANAFQVFASSLICVTCRNLVPST